MLLIDFKGRIQTIAGPTFATISILLWLTALLKGEFKHAKNKNQYINHCYLLSLYSYYQAVGIVKN